MITTNCILIKAGSAFKYLFFIIFAFCRKCPKCNRCTMIQRQHAYSIVKKDSRNKINKTVTLNHCPGCGYLSKPIITGTYH